MTSAQPDRSIDRRRGGVLVTAHSDKVQAAATVQEGIRVPPVVRFRRPRRRRDRGGVDDQPAAAGVPGYAGSNTASDHIGLCARPSSEGSGGLFIKRCFRPYAPTCVGREGAVMTMTLSNMTGKKKLGPSVEEVAARELVRLAKEQGLSLTGPDGPAQNGADACQW
jgi:hypothetical protein